MWGQGGAAMQPQGNGLNMVCVRWDPQSSPLKLDNVLEDMSKNWSNWKFKEYDDTDLLHFFLPKSR